jgi:hypothetical protein
MLTQYGPEYLHLYIIIVEELLIKMGHVPEIREALSEILGDRYDQLRAIQRAYVGTFEYKMDLS